MSRAAIALLLGLVVNSLMFLLIQQLIRDDRPLAGASVPIPARIHWLETRMPPPPAPAPKPVAASEAQPIEPPPMPAPASARSEPVVRELPTIPATNPLARLPSLESLLSQIPNPLPATPAPPASAVPASAPVLDDPRPRLRVPPVYPPMARRLGIEGEVLVEFSIGRDGRVADARVLESKPSRLFDASALRAIRAWEFEAPVYDGRPVEQRARQKFEFRLAD